MATTPRNSKWRTEFEIGGQRYRKTTDTKQEGEAWEAYIKLQVRQGGQPSVEVQVKQKTEAYTLGKAFKEACLHWAGTKNELNAIANARDVVDFLGADTPVSSLTKAHIVSLTEYIRSRKHPTTKGIKTQPLSVATVNRKLAALSKMLNIAQDNGVPVPVRVKQKKEGEGRTRFLTVEEEVAMLNAVQEHRGDAMRDFVGFAIETGGRLSEMLALKCRHFTQRGDTWFLTFPAEFTKNSKSRTIPLTEKCLGYIMHRIKGSPDTPIWPTEWNKYTVTHAWAYARKRMKLEKDREFVFHACRHTCATRLLEATGNIELVKEWLGHSDTKVTSRYAKVVPTSLMSAALAMNQRYSPQPVSGGILGGLSA